MMKMQKTEISQQNAFIVNSNNEIIEFRNECDIPKKSINWIKFLKEHTISEKLVDTYRASFDSAIWGSIFRKSRLGEDFLESLAADIGWKLVSEYQYLSEAFIQKHSQYLDWKVMSAKQKLNEKQIQENQDKLDWQSISWAQTLSANLIEKFKDKVNWEAICTYQKLDIKVIENNFYKLNKICWQNISQKQQLSDDLVNNYSEKIDWGFVSMNIHLTDAQLLKFKDKIIWNRLINYGRTLSYSLTLDLIANNSITFADIEDIVNERKKFELSDEQVKALKKTIKSLKNKAK